MKVDILSPAIWYDGLCDPYEARVYYETEVSNEKEIFSWLKEKLEEIIKLDEIHGFRFNIYINHEYVGDINKRTETIEINPANFIIACSVL